MQRELEGKVAIVTGASRGIGKATAELLAHRGASVIVNYSNSGSQAQETVDTIQKSGDKAIAIQCDISKASEVKFLVDAAVKHFGGLDILVNNAGAFDAKPVSYVTEEELDNIMAVNFKGPFFLCQHASRVMRNGGRIINISSPLVEVGGGYFTTYAASKAAVEQLTKNLAVELADKKITVNTVVPGITDTALLPKDYREIGASKSVFKRLGNPEDIAPVIAFLVSDQAGWVTGQKIPVNGGAFTI